MTLLLCVVVGAKAQTASDKYLDLANYATITTAGFGTNNGTTAICAFNEETNWLTIYAYATKISTSQQKWMELTGSDQTSTDAWEAQDVFKGSASYTTGPRVGYINSSNTYKFRVTNCKQAKILANQRSGSGTGRRFSLIVYEINADGTRVSETPVSSVTNTQNKKLEVVSSGELDPSKLYEVYIGKTDGSNEFLYEIAFEINNDTRTATSLSFAETSGTANLGGAFSLPAITKDPADLTGLTYESSNTSVASVDNTGAVTLKAVGKTLITVKYAGSETLRPCSATYELTIIDPNAKTVTATFPFNTGAAGQVATVSDDGVFSVTSVGVADMTYVGVASDQGVTGSKMQPSSQAADNKSQYVKFTVTPKKGITFIPKKVSFDAMRWGTDGSNKLHYYAECGSTSKELGNVNPNRNGKGLGWSHYEHNLSDINATSDNPFSLACYVYGLANTKQISFANIVIEGEYSGTAEEETMYAITTSVTPDGAGSVIQDPAGASLAEGTAVAFSATANTGYKFLDKWTVNGAEVDGTTYSVASLSGDLNVVAQFKKLYAISFTAGEGNKGTSNPLPTVYAETTYTAPAANYYIARDGYSVTGWTDGVNEYSFGEEITLTGDITLTPIFAANTKTISDTGASDVTITYGFDNTKGDPVINLENSSGYYVKKATFGGESIDVAMFIDNRDNAGIDGKRGKTNNVGRANAQINTGAKFTIPAVAGMTVAINKANGSLDGTTIAGDAYTETYTYTGLAETIDIIFMSDALYINSVVVTYPATSIDVTIASSGLSTLASAKALDFSAVDGLKAYVVNEVTKDAVSLKEVTEIPANTGVILEGTASTKYSVPVAASAEAPAVNKLAAAVAATAVEANAAYILKDGLFHLVTTASTVPAGKAYLPATEGPAGARSLRIVAADETTGIEALESAENAEMSVYNLQGQRVQRLQKGLNIVNGKKVIVK